MLKFLSMLLILMVGTVISYRTDIDEGGEKAFCEYRKHLTFKPTATCCAGKVVNPALEIDRFWQDCLRNDAASKSDTLEGIGWDIYSCMLGKASGGKTKLWLKDYSNLISENYPADIKSKIDIEIANLKSMPPAKLTNYAWLEKIRATYYDIEQWVCEGMSGEKNFGKIEMCSEWNEEDHRLGTCCKRSSPVDIRYKSVFDAESTKIRQQCRQDLQQGFQKLNATEVMQETLLDMCDVACFLQQQHQPKFQITRDILENHDYWKFDVADQLNKFAFIIPQFLPQNIFDDISKNITMNSTYIINSTIANIQNFTFADAIGGNSNTERSMFSLAYIHPVLNTTDEFKRKMKNNTFVRNEFMGRHFHPQIMHVPILCSAYKEIVSLIEYYVFSQCTPEEVTEPEVPPAEEPEPEKTQEEDKFVTTSTTEKQLEDDDNDGGE